MLVARQKLQQNFSRAAAEYDARAEFQHIQTRRVLDAALMLLPECATLADIGCGTGYFAFAARERRPAWRVFGVDISTGMCDVAAARCTAITGDAARLPLADGCVDAAVSSLCYQWVEDHTAAFAELARVLKPGGRAVIATLGAATLRELRECAVSAEMSLGLLPMRAFAETKTALTHSGFEISYADYALETCHYPSVAVLMDSMRSIGAGNNFAHATRGFLSPKRWAMMVADYEKHRTPHGIPATWEHHFFVLHKPL